MSLHTIHARSIVADRSIAEHSLESITMDTMSTNQVCLVHREEVMATISLREEE